MNHYNNTFINADEQFTEKVRIFFEKNKQEYCMLEITRKTKLSKTQVSLSLNELLKEKKIECVINQKDKKKYYVSVG
ncbi:MAG: hypothetical protein Q8S36_10060 [Sulfuricurvum sp.]|nr:hypothetical protein [Sulfuricurvum sp.]